MTLRTALTFIVLASLALAAGCSKQHEADKGSAVPTAKVTGATVEQVAVTAIPDMLELSGTVKARTSALVSARIPGTISVLRVREGDRVRKGQVLAQLDAQENQATAAVAVAGIDEAQRGVEEARSRKRLADVTFERYQKLFTEQAVTRQEFDVKQADRDLAAQGVARAEARLKQAQEGSRSASTMADYTKIIAPISGVITSKQADLGATVFPAQPLMTIEDEGNYQLELAVPENLVAMVKPGMAVSITLDAVGSSLNATIAEIVPAADPGSRTFIAKVNLGQKGLKSGMFGRCRIALGTGSKGIVVAKRAVVERGALTSVWVLDKENIARLRLVKTGKIVGDRVEILSGLSDGDRVVVSGVDKITEGAKVE